MNQFQLEQRAKVLEIKIAIAIREYQFDEADKLNDELYATHIHLDIMNRNYEEVKV